MHDRKLSPVPSCALVIPTYGREEVLCQTIREILKQSHAPEEFVIVDQSESHTASTEQFLKKQVRLGNLRWVRHSPPSTSGARNRGLKETTSDILLFIDDDILTHPNFIEAHLANYSDPSIDAVCGQVRGIDNKTALQVPPNMDWHDLIDVNYKLPRNYAMRVESTGALSGGNFSVRRKAVRKIEGFNMYASIKGEDSDIAFRLLEKRCRIVFDPDAYIIHLAAPTGGCRPDINRTWQDDWVWAAGYPYLAFRYVGRSHRPYFFWLMWVTLRSTVLYKKNLSSPFRWFRSVAIFSKAVCEAYQWAKLREPLISYELKQ